MFIANVPMINESFYIYIWKVEGKLRICVSQDPDRGCEAANRNMQQSILRPYFTISEAS